ncbi:hypothetical protein J6590_083069 [Homalodisca vitripennis]|nr:hypothetical protein J6590_083069 [Homalodisca vitripennis]
MWPLSKNGWAPLPRALIAENISGNDGYPLCRRQSVEDGGRCECLAKLGEENCLDVFKEFNNIQSKNEQDLHLQGLIDVVDVQQRRPRPNVENKEQKSASFSYHIIVGTERKQVCFQAFLCVFSITEKRVRRIRNLKLLGQTPEDKRGRKVSHALPFEVHRLVDDHIKSFPLKETHYKGKKAIIYHQI